MVKIVSPTGVASYFEVGTTATGNTATLRIPATVSTFLVATAPAASALVEGRLYVCTGTGASAGTRTTMGGTTPTAAQFQVTGDEIDAKGTITCEATRP